MVTQTALLVAGVGRYEINTNVPILTPPPGTMLCKVKAVALNPADWKMVDFVASRNSIGGTDVAAEVVDVGEGVTRFKKGDRIFSMMFGINPLNKFSGTFCQYAICTEDVSCKISASLNYENASALGVAVGTAGTALFQTLALPMPDSGKNVRKPSFVLISGGATAMGTMAIQLLRLSGFIPVATCSPSNRDLVLSFGAEETFDYHSPTCGIEVRNYTKNELHDVLDCISTAESMKMCYEAIGSAGGKYVALDPFSTHIQYTRREIQAEWIMVCSLFGGPVKFSGVYGRPARPQDRAFASVLFPVAERLIGKGLIRPHPIEVRSGGLAAIVDGIEDLRNGHVKGRKLVYPIA